MVFSKNKKIQISIILKNRSYVLFIKSSSVKYVPKLCKNITQVNPLIIIYMHVRFMQLLKLYLAKMKYRI